MRRRPASGPSPARLARYAVRAAAVVALVLAAGGCRRPTPVVLLTVDTLRADHLAVYGYPRDTAPALGRLAADGVVFERAFTTAPKTTPAYASLLTGQYPFRHGLRVLGQELAADNHTLAELLGAAGFDTAGFVSSTVMIDRLSALGQGSRRWDDRMPSPERTRANFERRAEATIAAVEDSLAAGFEPGLLFIHLIDPHGPYRPPEPFASRFASAGSTPIDPADVPPFQRLDGARTIEDYVDAYDGEIAYADHALGTLLDRLRALGIYDRALIVATADHGESLGDDGSFFRHGKTLDESSTRVPLIIKPPGGRSGRTPARWPGVVSLVDVVPTVLDYTGVDAHDPLDGISLRPILEGRASRAERTVFSSRAAGPRVQWAAHDGRGTYRTAGCFGPAGAPRKPCEAHFAAAIDGIDAEEARNDLKDALRAFVARAADYERPFSVTWRYRPGDKNFVRDFVRDHNMRWARYRDDDAHALRSLGYLD